MNANIHCLHAVSFLQGALMFTCASAFSETLPCVLGSNSDYGSSWCDLPKMEKFGANGTLKITLENDGAKVVAVRLLQLGHNSSQPLDVVEWNVNVPEDHMISVRLSGNYPATTQISVHGGPNAWEHKFPKGNKPAVLLAVDR